jgi:hypothetical protein
MSDDGGAPLVDHLASLLVHDGSMEIATENQSKAEDEYEEEEVEDEEEEEEEEDDDADDEGDEESQLANQLLSLTSHLPNDVVLQDLSSAGILGSTAEPDGFESDDEIDHHPTIEDPTLSTLGEMESPAHFPTDMPANIMDFDNTTDTPLTWTPTSGDEVPDVPQTANYLAGTNEIAAAAAVAAAVAAAGTAIDDDEWDGNHPTAMSNPNPNTLGSGNFNLTDFLRHWAGSGRNRHGLDRERERYPWMRKINEQAMANPVCIRVSDLEGDECDMQGMDWEDLGVTRRDARERRRLTYNNYVNKPGSDRWQVSWIIYVSGLHLWPPSLASISVLCPMTDPFHLLASGCPTSTLRELLPIPPYGHQTQCSPLAFPTSKPAGQRVSNSDILRRNGSGALVQPRVWRE